MYFRLIEIKTQSIKVLKELADLEDFVRRRGLKSHLKPVGRGRRGGNGGLSGRAGQALEGLSTNVWFLGPGVHPMYPDMIHRAQFAT